MIPSFTEQLRRHSVALISLVVAISSLAYNTWRNEVTEENRNLRSAGFELIGALADLDLTVLQILYASAEGCAPQLGARKQGWVQVLVIRDLGRVLPDSVRASTDALYGAWDEHSDMLLEQCDADSHEAIEAALEATRMAALAMLQSLD